MAPPNDLEATCPACRNPRRRVKRADPHFPFCSPECRLRDLAAWANEEYRLSGAGPSGSERPAAEPGDEESRPS